VQKLATTFRLDAYCREGLARLSKLWHQPANKIVNEAVREYLARQTAKVENELTETLKDLRAYRKRDPDFKNAIAAFADAEVSASGDPAEGRVVKKSAGPAQAAVRGLLDG